MRSAPFSRSQRNRQTQINLRAGNSRQRPAPPALPPAAYRQRGGSGTRSEPFNAPEVWHDPEGSQGLRFVVEKPGDGYIHAVTIEDVRERIAQLPKRFTRDLAVVQFSRMTRKRALFPCYGMQWGPNVYLYPIEETLVEVYVRPPRPRQIIEAKMYGGQWSQSGNEWLLTWTPETIRDFYLNNILIHEIGHVNDNRNTSYVDRERYANWFAEEYGYRASRGRR